MSHGAVRVEVNRALVVAAGTVAGQPVGAVLSVAPFYRNGARERKREREREREKEREREREREREKREKRATVTR